MLHRLARHTFLCRTVRRVIKWLGVCVSVIRFGKCLYLGVKRYRFRKSETYCYAVESKNDHGRARLYLPRKFRREKQKKTENNFANGLTTHRSTRTPLRAEKLPPLKIGEISSVGFYFFEPIGIIGGTTSYV